MSDTDDFETTPSGWPEAAADRYMNALTGVADELRKLAGRVERAGEPRETVRGGLVHVLGAARVSHEIAWGVANLNIGRLVECAADADETLGTSNTLAAPAKDTDGSKEMI